MSVRTCIRHSPHLPFLSSLRQSPNRIPPYPFRSLSLSTQESTKPSVVPRSPSTAPTSSLRETKRPETLHTPPAPPRNDTAPASTISTPSDKPLPTSSPPTNVTPQVTQPSKPKQEPRFAFKPLKAALTLSPNAISRLKEMLDQPEPKLVRVGVKNRGCAGLAYHLEYVDKPGKFDEVVEQDGVKVLIDSRALFSIIGSTMDFVEDRLSARFVFDNPHVKGSCGCGESFSVS